jgi:hypothetical protein
MKLCEKTGRRLRRQGYAAYGVSLSLRFVAPGPGRYNGWGHYISNASYWQESRKTAHPLYATQEIYQAAAAILQQTRFTDKVSQMSVHVFNVRACEPEQVGLFDEDRSRHKALAQAADDANDRYGEFSVVPASMAGMDKTILDRIAFGNVREV